MCPSSKLGSAGQKLCCEGKANAGTDQSHASAVDKLGNCMAVALSYDAFEDSGGDTHCHVTASFFHGFLAPRCQFFACVCYYKRHDHAACLPPLCH
jgi:hypothetical protein